MKPVRERRYLRQQGMKMATRSSALLAFTLAWGLVYAAAFSPARAGQNYDCPTSVEVVAGGQRCALSGAAASAGWRLSQMTFDATVGARECPSGGAELEDGRILDHWEAGNMVLNCSYQQAQALYVIAREAVQGAACYRERDMDARPVKVRFVCR